MKTVQMTLDDNLVQRVDKIVKYMHTTRSAFTRDALQQAIVRINMQKQEEKHRSGYGRKPVEIEEFSVWEKEQKWGDA